MTSRAVAFIKPLGLTKARWLAPLSKRYARIAALRALPPDLARIAGNCIVFKGGGAVFVKNHKAACSTIARLIYRHEHGVDYTGNIHKEYSGLTQGLPNFPEVAAALLSPDSFKFTFVRHPVSRAVSAYKNIFLERANDARSLHADSIARWGFSETAGAAENFDVFLDYVTESLRRDPHLTDPHFRRQVDNTGIECVQFDFVGRVEEMEASLGRLSGVLDAATQDPEGRAVHRANRSAVNFTPDAGQIARLEEIYRSDFERFGYVRSGRPARPRGLD